MMYQMKNGNGIKRISAILLIVSPILGLIEPLAANLKNTSTISEAQIIATEDSPRPNRQKQKQPEKYSYRADGTTSASKLVAKRSHSVSKNDETGLSIFLGVIVIGVIVFFLKPFGDKK